MSKRLKGDLAKEWDWMERQVQCKHFIEYYFISDSIKQTFLGHLCVHGTKCITENSSRCVCRHNSLQPQAFSDQREMWLLFLYLSQSLMIWSMKTNVRAVGFSQNPSLLSKASEIFSTMRKKTGTWSLQRGLPSTAQPSTGENGERAQEPEPPTP